MGSTHLASMLLIVVCPKLWWSPSVSRETWLGRRDGGNERGFTNRDLLGSWRGEWLRCRGPQWRTCRWWGSAGRSGIERHLCHSSARCVHPWKRPQKDTMSFEGGGIGQALRDRIVMFSLDSEEGRNPCTEALKESKFKVSRIECIAKDASVQAGLIHFLHTMKVADGYVIMSVILFNRWCKIHTRTMSLSFLSIASDKLTQRCYTCRISSSISRDYKHNWS